MPAVEVPPELRRVTGPSATAGGFKRFFHLLYLIAVTDFKKVYFNTALGYVWSLLRPTVLTGLFNLGLNMIVVFIFMLAFGVNPMWTWLLFPVVVASLLIITVAAAMLLSVLYVRFRDVMIIWSVATTMLFYATPVLYPIEQMPEEFRTFAFISPLTVIMEQARVWIIDSEAPGAVAAAGGWLHLVPAIVIYIGICVIAVRVFSREAPRIAEEL
jgi:ABC-2 type transport system permease protein